MLGLAALAAPAEQLPLKLYTTADGLASDRVHCILSDSHGFLWFGTSDGLTRFDGDGFRGFSESAGLPPLPIEAMLEDREGVYWLGTNQGLVRWDASRGAASSHGSATRLFHLPGGGPRDHVLSVLEDGTSTLWIGTEDGLFRFDRRAAQPGFQGVPLRENSEGTLPVNALVRDPDGVLWVGTESGLYRLSAYGKAERVADDRLAPHAVRCLARDRRGSLWVGTHEEGLYEIGGSSPPSVRRAFGVGEGLAGRLVTNLFESSDGKLWAACYGGLSEIAADRASIRSYTTQEGLSGLGMWSLAEDRSGNLWVGSDDAGVMRLARDGFRRFDERDGLMSLRVGSLFETRDGAVCAFTRGRRPEEIADGDGFLECFDGRRFHTQRLRLPDGTLFGWGWSQVTLQDHTGEWWVPTLSGLFRFPSVSFESLGGEAARRVYTERDGLPRDGLFRLFEDSRGDLWIGLVGEGNNLVHWDRRTDAMRVFGAADGIPGRQPMAFAEDRSGAIWVGLREGGLVRWRDGRMTLFDSGSGLPPGSIRALHTDREGRLWIASSRGGIAHVDRPEASMPQFSIFALAQGLSSDNTSALAEDRFGRIYVGTEHGLDRLDPPTGNVQLFTADDGLARGVVEAAWRDRSGDLWFGSVEGLSRLTPVAAVAPASPLVRISGVLVNGDRQPLSDLGATDVSLSTRSSEPTSVEIDFLALDFAAGGRPRYQYRVDGLDRDWTAPTAQPSVVYARLPSGSYRFRVRAIANDGSVGASEADVRFRVLPYFWKRPEVLGLLVLATAGIAWALHRSRLQRALAVERVRTRVATDLHDDVGAGLSEIAILSELPRSGSGREPAGVLEEIGERARSLVDSMSDIVWSTDPRRDDVASLTARIRHFAANMLEARGVAWTVEVPPEFEPRTLEPERRRQLFLIVKEALTNVARHSRATHAAVRIVPGPRDVVIEVEDDGVGLDTDEASTGTGSGLANMRARTLGLDGTFVLGPGSSGGTRIVVCVPRAGTVSRSA